MTLHITANKQPLIFLDEELGVIDGQNTFCTVAASLSQGFPGVPHLAVARVCRAVLEPGVTAGYHVPKIAGHHSHVSITRAQHSRSVCRGNYPSHPSEQLAPRPAGRTEPELPRAAGCSSPAFSYPC